MILFMLCVSLSVCVCVCVCACVRAVVLEAMQKWRTEKESRLSGEKQQEEEEEEESIYTVHTEEVNTHLTFQELPGFPGVFKAFVEVDETG